MTIIDPIAHVAVTYDITEAYDMMIALQMAFSEAKSIDGSGYACFDVPEHILGQVAANLSWLVRVKISGEPVSQYLSINSACEDVVYKLPLELIPTPEQLRAKGNKTEPDMREKFNRKLKRWAKLSEYRPRVRKSAK
jgi:hypothetical protein